MHTSLPLLLLLVAGAAYCQETTTLPSTDTTATTPTPSDTTPADTTTKAVPTTTSADTTTKAVPTTTEAPTTPTITTDTPTTPETTSAKMTTHPHTTPTPVVPTTPVPKPPTPVLGSWNVTEGNVTCIRADLQIRFMIPSDEGKDDYVVLSPNATAEGTCSAANNTQQELRIVDSDFILAFTFEKDVKSTFVKNITFNNIQGVVYNDTQMFQVTTGNSYLCSSSETIPLGANVSMEVFQIHIQAFGNTNNGEFGTAEECDADNNVNDIVPIAVGCCLLALVVIVLIAYFVGRRRSRQKGYQSV